MDQSSRAESRRRSSSRQDKRARKSSAGSASTRAPQAVSLALLNDDRSARIHAAVKKILWEVGVIIDHTETRQMLMDNHGCREGDDGFIRMPAELIDQAISTVPKRITLYDLNGNLAVDTRQQDIILLPRPQLRSTARS